MNTSCRALNVFMFQDLSGTLSLSNIHVLREIRTSLFKTYRCHKKEFLPKFAKDRTRWINWLYEVKKRYGLCVLNYIVTSNHIHLLVLDTAKNVMSVMSNSMQLIAGRTAQEYNKRKKRQGAFWEDRYHATAIDTNEYLLRCIVYVDMNMVRTGVVTHPSQWPASGYNKIRIGVGDQEKASQVIEQKQKKEIKSLKCSLKCPISMLK